MKQYRVKDDADNGIVIQLGGRSRILTILKLSAAIQIAWFLQAKITVLNARSVKGKTSAI